MLKRYSIFPIKHYDLWGRYEKAKQQHWDVDEVDFSNDKYNSLLDREKKVLDTILAFFLVSDGLVIENLVHNVIEDVEEEEAQFFYGFQLFNEQIHAETYGLTIESYIEDNDKKEFLYSPIENMSTVKKKADWALKWIDSKNDLPYKIASFACVEGLFFSSLFATVFYFRESGKLNGLCQANELIMKDEQSHYEFALNYYHNYIEDPLTKRELKEIILDAYEVEKVFVEELLSEGLAGLSKDKMIQYVQFVTDTILVDFKMEKHFNVSQPLDYMAKIALDARSNFFEAKIGTYTKIKRSKELFDEDF